MSSDLLTGLVAFEIWAFVLGLTGVVFYQLMTGRINLSGLLHDKRPAKPLDDEAKAAPQERRLSATRVQLLTLTMAGAFAYIALLPEADPGSLPEVSRELLLLVGGSSSIYLGGKSTRLISAEYERLRPKQSNK